MKGEEEKLRKLKSKKLSFLQRLDKMYPKLTHSMKWVFSHALEDEEEDMFVIAQRFEDNYDNFILPITQEALENFPDLKSIHMFEDWVTSKVFDCIMREMDYEETYDYTYTMLEEMDSEKHTQMN